MKTILLCISLLIFFSCSKPQHHVNDFDNGVFEVSYTSKEGEQINSVMNKLQLLSAYAAKRRGCRHYKEYNASANPLNIEAQHGFWTIKTKMSRLYICSSAKKSMTGVLDADEIIRIQESRYGRME